MWLVMVTLLIAISSQQTSSLDTVAYSFSCQGLLQNILKHLYSQSSRKRTPSGVKKVSVTGVGRLQECENTEFVWKLNKTGFD